MYSVNRINIFTQKEKKHFFCGSSYLELKLEKLIGSNNSWRLNYMPPETMLILRLS